MGSCNTTDPLRDKLRQTKAKKNNDLYRDEPISPNKKLYVTLPICPSINHMYVGNGKGGKILTRLAKDYVLRATARINEAIDDQKWQIDYSDVWFYMDMYVYMPDRKIRDSHNTLKLLLDVFQGVAFKDDYFIMPRIQRVEYDKDNPRMELCLHPQTTSERAKRHMYL